MNLKRLFIDLTDPVVFQTFGGEQIWTRIFAPAGTAVFKEGDVGQDFYFVFSGSLVVDKSIKDKSSTQKRIATLGVGDFFGEGALLSDKTRAATVTATSDSVLLKLTQKSFEQLLVTDPHAAVGIILGIVKVVNARLQETNERLVLLHNVARLVRDSNGSSELALKSIVEELQGVTRYGKVLVFGTDGTYKAVTEGLDSEELNSITIAFNKVLPLLSAKDAASSYVDGDYLFVSIPGLDGTVRGVLVVQVSPDCLQAESRMMLTVAEQLGHLV